MTASTLPNAAAPARHPRFDRRPRDRLGKLTVRSLACAAMCVALGGWPPAHAQAAHGYSIRTHADLTWADLPSLPPGARIAVLEGPMGESVPFTARLRFPAQYRIPPHWHPAIEHVTVLAGTFYMGHGETHDPARAMALPPGGFAVMQARTPHFAFTLDEPVEIQLHGVGPWGVTYIDPREDPRRKP